MVYEVLQKALDGQHINFHKSFPALYDEVIKQTIWMVNPRPLERAYCIVHGLTEYPKCPVCDKNCKWTNTVKRYSRTCGSKECRYASAATSNREIKARQSPEQKMQTLEKTKKTIEARYGSEQQYWQIQAEKKRETMLERYGVEYTGQSPQLRQKQEQTVTERYGAKHIFNAPGFQEAARRANRERYGVDWHQQSQIGKEAREQTNIERYGARTPMGAEHIREKAKRTLVEKYGTDELSKINIEKRNSTIREKYGVDNYKQSHIDQSILDMLDDREWLVDQHHNQQKTLVVIASELGVDPKTVGGRMAKHAVDVRRFGTSTGERELIDFLQRHGIAIDLRSRSIITPYELDLYLPHYRIAIEYCGLYWHSDIHPRMDRTYHLRKLEMCNDKSIRLITIYEDEWASKRKIVEQKLLNVLGLDSCPPINARQCEVKMVKSSELGALYDDCHIQGRGRGSICFGLYHANVLVGGMSFISHGNKQYELNRFATRGRIRGGFSKLLAAFEREVEWATITSYADRRWSEGGVYQLSGFDHSGNTKPSYWYLSKDKTQRVHRSHFRRNKLSSALAVYDQALTEFQNCDNNGVLRIWDCGLIRYVKHAR